MSVGFHPCPKPEPRAKAKRAARAHDVAQMHACYCAVNARDGYRCRVCRAKGNPQALDMLDRLHHHHLIYRSRGGTHTTATVLLVCRFCHDLVHVSGTLKLSGDADLRDHMGKLGGVLCEWLTDSGWTVEKFV